MTTTRRRKGGKVYESVLLRRSIRDGKTVRHVTLGNISHLPAPVIEMIRRALKGEVFAPVASGMSVPESLPSGHVDAVLGTIRRLGLDTIVSSEASRKRDLVVGMIAARLLFGVSKLSTVSAWKTTTLARDLKVEDADENELYAAMDWLLSRQEAIEKKLARKHLKDGGFALFDTSTSFYTGETCPLAQYGYDRDKKGLPVILYGVLTNDAGIPVSVTVYPGNTGDPSTVVDQAERLRNRFGMHRMVLAADRGVLAGTQVETLKNYPGLGWLSALRSEAIRSLLDREELQLSLFDERNLMEISSSEFPGERLIACFNPVLCEDRRRTREELLQETEKDLLSIQKAVARRKRKKLSGEEIGLMAGRVIGRHKMAKHFVLTIADSSFSFSRNQAAIDAESLLDGLYVLRTSEPAVALSAEDAVRRYKSLSQVEMVFRTLKGLDVRIRPIYHRTEAHVRAHVFLCLLAYYVEWHMRKAWAPLLFADEELEETRFHRDPVLKAEPSQGARKKKTERNPDGSRTCRRFDVLLRELGTRCRNTVRVAATDAQFTLLTEPTPLQAQALSLLGL